MSESNMRLGLALEALERMQEANEQLVLRIGHLLQKGVPEGILAMPESGITAHQIIFLCDAYLGIPSGEAGVAEVQQ